MPALVLLAVAIAFEVTATVMLRVSDGMSKLWPSVTLVVCYCVSFYLLSLVLRELQISFAYAAGRGSGPRWWRSSACSPGASRSTR